VRQLPEIMRVPEGSGLPDNPKTIAFSAPAKVTVIRDDKALTNLKLSDTTHIYSRAAGKHGKDPRVIIVGDGKEANVLDLASLSRKTVAAKLKELKAVIGYD